MTSEQPHSFLRLPTDEYLHTVPAAAMSFLHRYADHGLYAHQTPTFDSFTASQEFPMHITEHSTSSSYKIVGEVAGVLKMTGKDKDAKTKPLPGEKATSAQDITAHIEFRGPAMVRWSRHDKEGNTNFISAFYLLPEGFGRTRFMSRYVAKYPLLAITCRSLARLC